MTKFRDHTTRERLKALVSAIEDDMVAVCLDHIVPHVKDNDWLYVKDDSRRARAISRFGQKPEYDGLNYRDHPEVAPLCMDFAGILQLWSWYRHLLPMDAKKELQHLNDAVSQYLTVARNSVSHVGDSMYITQAPRNYYETHDFCHDAAERRPNKRQTNSAHTHIENGRSTIRIQIRNIQFTIIPF